MIKLEVGDKVKYSRDFLRSIGELAGPLPFAKGTVKGINFFGSMAIAKIDWRDDNIPKCINVNNLIKIGTVENV